MNDLESSDLPKMEELMDILEKKQKEIKRLTEDNKEQEQRIEELTTQLCEANSQILMHEKTLTRLSKHESVFRENERLKKLEEELRNENEKLTSDNERWQNQKENLDKRQRQIDEEVEARAREKAKKIIETEKRKLEAEYNEHMKALDDREKNIRREESREWIPLPISWWGNAILLVFLVAIGFLTYWGGRVWIADYKSERYYECRTPRNQTEKDFPMLAGGELGADGKIYFKAKYVIALVNAQFTNTADSKSLMALASAWKSLRYVPPTPRSTTKKRKKK